LSVHFKGRDHLGDIGVNDRIILKWILQGWELKEWTELTQARAFVNVIVIIQVS
jgi:hypothetical protein